MCLIDHRADGSFVGSHSPCREYPTIRTKGRLAPWRLIPLSRRVCACSSLWLERLPDAAPDNYLFPLHKIGLAGNSPCRYSTTLISSDRWVPGARAGGGPAKLHYRPHDMRHTFISRLAENPNVSEQTIKALAGHVSRQMLERYSHIRSQAKQAAIKALERGAIEPNLQPTGHRIGHSDASMHGADQANSQKTNSGPGRIRTYDQRIMSSKKTETQ
jgi:hypothetical protein